MLAPPLDIFRLDLTLGHFILFSHNWTLGIDRLLSGEISAVDAAVNIVLRGFVPIVLIIIIGIGVSWCYGRLYCGWLCPHFSVVEMINALMRRACGRPTLWEATALPEDESDGSHYVRRSLYWVWTALAIITFASLWALSLLTYLLPPKMIYHNLIHGQLTFNQMIFLSVATTLFSLEFLLARHLFCRFGCAVGLFQSLAWMTNDRALVVNFDRNRGDACKSCTQACDNSCPMRLNPRKNKRHMFTCTQCTRCVDACNQVMAPAESLLQWRDADQKVHQAPVNFTRGR